MAHYEVEIFPCQLSPGQIRARYEASPVACLPAPEGLIGWWDGDVRPARDLVGANHGTVIGNGLQYSRGLVGVGFELSGIDDYIEIADDPSLDLGASDLTITAWIRIAGYSASEDQRFSVLCKASSISSGPGLPTPGFELLVDGPPSAMPSGTLKAFWGNTFGGLNQWDSGRLVEPGSWHLVALTVDQDDPEGLRFYLDGQLAGPKLNPVPFMGSLDNTEPLRIGSGYHGDLARGMIDEVQLYDRALSDGEILNLFAQGSFGVCKDDSWVVVVGESSGVSTSGGVALVGLRFGSVVVTVDTYPGYSNAAIASDLSALINGNVGLVAQGISASISGDRLEIRGCEPASSDQR